MKNLGKELNKVKKEVKRKLTKEDLKHFTPDKIVKDLNVGVLLVKKLFQIDQLFFVVLAKNSKLFH